LNKYKIFTFVWVKILRYILLPIVPIYYLITWLRNVFYDIGFFKSTSYDLPIICVGNLSVGGTGKTPMVAHLIEILNTNNLVASLSRGYKRKSTGFVLADNNATVETIGDEPFQLFKKFEGIIVSVAENRRQGIFNLESLDSVPDVILLDDAFQHRKVKAGLNILLTSYNNLYIDDLPLPTGNLREPASGAKRAHIIVVTKCPENISEDEKASIKKRLQILPHQLVYFSTVIYSKSILSSEDNRLLKSLNQSFTLVTGIANSEPLVEYLQKSGFNFNHLNYPDHHEFSEGEIAEINKNDFVLTTEKDYWRLVEKVNTQLYYLPIEIKISAEKDFNESILNFVSRY